MPIDEMLTLYNPCKLCPRKCKVNRFERLGYCKSGIHLIIGYVGPHFGEEPPISGKNGSGTIFFSGCSLRCSYCQNYQISHKHIGKTYGIQDLFEEVVEMIDKHKVHNINFVTFDHYIPHAIELMCKIKKAYDIPIVANISGYQAIGSLKLLEDFVDIYLPDFKYSDPQLAKDLSNAFDYPKIALNALYEMAKQKGMLTPISEDTNQIAKRGLLVRHLILPGWTQNSIDALTMLFCEFGRSLPVSIMSQYYPILPQKDPELNRAVRSEEFQRVLDHALDLGFEHIYIQFPEEDLGRIYLPDFETEDPFQITLSKGQEKTFKERSPSLSQRDLRAP